MGNTEQNSTNNKKEITFKELLANDDTLKTIDDLIKRTNLAISAALLEIEEGKCENVKESIQLIEDTRKEVAKSFLLKHYYIMALYAKYKKDESPESPLSNKYW
jgi:hypothetical protein